MKSGKIGAGELNRLLGESHRIPRYFSIRPVPSGGQDAHVRAGQSRLTDQEQKNSASPTGTSETAGPAFVA